jgi:uncharacterized protein (DUF983 family)
MPTNLPMPRRSIVLRRGFARLCPNCGKGRLFKGYLTLVERCDYCGERLGHIRADDLPAYLTIFLVGHVVVGLMLVAVQAGIPNWLGISVSLTLTVGLTLGLLPVIKGVVAAHLWRLKLPRGSAEAEEIGNGRR